MTKSSKEADGSKGPLFSQAQERVEEKVKELMKKKEMEHKQKLQQAKEKQNPNK